MSKLQRLLCAATVLTSLGAGFGRCRRNGLPGERGRAPDPSFEQFDAAVPALANPLNKPITGASEDPLVVGTEPPPSLEALQATRPGDEKGDGLEPGRADDAAHRRPHLWRARRAWPARSFAINEMLRRYRAELDTAYDFRALVLPVGSGQTLMRPPVVSAAQMAFALGEGGQVARETSCIYQITREAQLASAPPNWRTYLVRSWGKPRRPADGGAAAHQAGSRLLEQWVAEGWAQGEKQAVEIFLSDLGRLERDIVGMARYRVLLRARLVEQPKCRLPVGACPGRPRQPACRRPHDPDHRPARSAGQPRAAGPRARAVRNEPPSQGHERRGALPMLDSLTPPSGKLSLVRPDADQRWVRC